MKTLSGVDLTTNGVRDRTRGHPGIASSSPDLLEPGQPASARVPGAVADLMSGRTHAAATAGQADVGLEHAPEMRAVLVCAVRYAAVRAPNQVVSASGSPE